MKLENFDRVKEIVDLISYNERQINRIQSSTYVAFTTPTGHAQFEIAVHTLGEPYYELANNFLVDVVAKIQSQIEDLKRELETL
jgi:hypothetical protein